ncbi:HPr family phosphocarrier protein [Labrys monachus]|uniref:Phosphocarrier protein n=1 Tax=Labrys monachus TaxID=217067 RepID=A0ABU0FLF7_9HYPH|nr:HPr family phosphocarrier protein [Labrys monachus]MDQ0395420.1 phosphocarrier protein [Labrys monachus]
MSSQGGADPGNDGPPCEEAPVPLPSVEGAIVRVLPIVNNKGLHARASAKFVQTVEGFDAAVKVSRCGETVGGQSIMGLMMLAAARGTTITVETSGRQAEACMEAIEALLAHKFGEES